MAVPFAQGTLDVGDGHHLYYAEFGEPLAPAIVVLHGGPGSACNSAMLEWFDLAKHRVVLFDQRGCGRSIPKGGLACNTTQDLIGDIERLRRHLGISTWLVVGGSWGALLGLLYAGTHPASVHGMVLRGVFLPRDEQLNWFFQDLKALVPVAWRHLTADMNSIESVAVLPTLSDRLLRGTPAIASDTAIRWGRYEDAVMAAMLGRQSSPEGPLQAGQLEKYRVQAHYLSRACFLTERDLYLALQRIAVVPVFVHGTHDWICPPGNVVRLMDSLPQADVRWVAKGTHTTADPMIRDALRLAVKDYEHAQ